MGENNRAAQAISLGPVTVGFWKFDLDSPKIQCMQIYEQMSCPSDQDPSLAIEISPSSVVNARCEISGVIARGNGHETTVVLGCNVFKGKTPRPLEPDRYWTSGWKDPPCVVSQFLNDKIYGGSTSDERAMTRSPSLI